MWCLSIFQRVDGRGGRGGRGAHLYEIGQGTEAWRICYTRAAAPTRNSIVVTVRQLWRLRMLQVCATEVNMDEKPVVSCLL
jgi:hypothetical protein